MVRRTLIAALIAVGCGGSPSDDVLSGATQVQSELAAGSRPIALVVENADSVARPLSVEVSVQGPWVAVGSSMLDHSTRKLAPIAPGARVEFPGIATATPGNRLSLDTYIPDEFGGANSGLGMDSTVTAETTECTVRIGRDAVHGNLEIRCNNGAHTTPR
ncbi:hypothetical protein DRW03_21340 [Corallococcus sp. H22C18031201]|nr:hypothetical protein DRW03_21340 [Corallococcus sp. H22C18031201]